MESIRTTIELRLKFAHESFTARRQDEFIHALAETGKCQVSEIQVLSVRAGCTIVRARMPASAVRIIADILYDLVHSSSPDLPDAIDQALPGLSAANRTLFGRFHLDAIHYEIRRAATTRSLRRAVAFVPGWSKSEKPFGSWPVFLFNEWNAKGWEIRAPVFSRASKEIRIDNASDALSAWVEREARNAELSIVAHSLGGLIVRRFILDASRRQPRLDTQITSLVFISSPHEMANFATAAAKRMSWLDDSKRDSLQLEIRLLERLDNEWKDWVTTHVPIHCQLRSFWGAADQILGHKPNALSNEEQVKTILGQDHMTIANVTSPADEIAMSYREFLIESGFFEKKASPEADHDAKQFLRKFFSEYYESVWPKSHLEHLPPTQVDQIPKPPNVESRNRNP